VAPPAGRNRSSRDIWDDAAKLLRVVAHPVRLGVLAELSKGAKCVMDIRELFPVSQPVLSQHMAVLRKAGLVSNHARGPLRCYYLTRPVYTKNLLKVVTATSTPRIRSRDVVLAEVDRAAARRGRKGRAKP